MSEGGMDRRKFLRGAAGLAAGLSVAKPALSEVSQQEQRNVPKEESNSGAEKQEHFNEATVHFVGLLDKSFRALGQQEGPAELGDAFGRAEEEYLNRFCEQGGVSSDMRTSAIDAQAMFDAFAYAVQLPSVDQRIMGNLFLSARAKLGAASQESLSAPNPGKPMDLLDANEREA